MKIFISWSGATSRQVAVALSNWLPKVIQGVHPFVSAKDIDKGTNWTYELTKELNDTNFGIICLAPDNLVSPWLNYEAGAITKSVDSRVAPVLFHVTKEDVQPPMSQLQMTEIALEEFELLMASVNKAAGSPLSGEQVKESVSVWWPSLQEAIGEIEVPEKAPGISSGPLVPSEPVKPTADMAEILNDVLGLVRQFDRKLNRMESSILDSTESARDAMQKRAARNFLRSEIRDIGGSIRNISVGTNRINVKLIDSLPESENPRLMDIARTVAKNESIETHISMPDRTLVADPTGEVTEIPF